MLKFKLSRQGKKKQPSYRIIVTEHTKDPWGKATEIVGFYNPMVTPSEIRLKTDRIEHWLSQGAQPTNTVHNIFVSQGILKDKKKTASNLGKKYKEKLKAEAEEAKKKEAEAHEAKKAAAEKPVKEEPKKEEAPKAEDKKEEEKPAE